MRTRTALMLGGGAVLATGTALALVYFGFVSPSDGYESSLRYPLRSDRLVVTVPKTPPLERHANGKLDEFLAGLTTQPGAVVFDPATADAAAREKLDAVLLELFGTPAAPTVSGGEKLGLTPESMAAGSRLYKDKCVNCHGLTGDGRGPTSLWVYPPARDLRRGQYKYVSTPGGIGVPTREDLTRLIRRGIDGNSMPPFDLLSDEQVRDVVNYNIHLTLRGQVEFEALAALLGEDGLDDPAAFCKQRLTAILTRWSSATPLEPKSKPDVTPKEAGSNPEYDARIRRGRELFAGSGACLGCHKDYGRERHWLYDLWGVAVQPSELTEGHYKAGGEPLDLFRRIACGIAPSGMPAAQQLTEDQKWDVVAFVKALPVPRHLPSDVRKQVYPQAD